MSELVLMHHNEPMTTSMAIADGTGNTHESIIKLVRKYVEDLQIFGPCGFEIQMVERKQGGGRPIEYAYLNEQQATLLITYLRNTDIVRRFKIALVKAFYELRDRLAESSAPIFSTGNLSHGADLAVSADRTFRGFLRSARAAGLRLPAALRVANQQTVARTGMDMLAALGVVPENPPGADGAALEYDPYAIDEFMRHWLSGELPIPVTHCRSVDLYAAYEHWRKDGGTVAPANLFGGQVTRYGEGVQKRMVWVKPAAVQERRNCRAVILSWLDAYGQSRPVRLAEEFDRFDAALSAWSMAE